MATGCRGRRRLERNRARHPLQDQSETDIGHPQLLMVDGAHVASVRDSLRRGEPQFRPALNALEADANRALTVAPISVMDKDCAQHAARLVQVWFLDPATRMNPNLRFGQRIPGFTDGRAAGTGKSQSGRCAVLPRTAGG